MSKMITLLQISLLLLISPALFGQFSFDWGIAIGGSQYDEATDVAVDASGNAYVIGTFVDSVDIDPDGSGQVVKAGGFREILLAKYSPTGELLWGFALGDQAWDRPWAMTTDAAGSVYVAGVFSGDIEVNPLGNSTTLSSNPAGFWPDGFLLKYDTNGQLIWANHIKTARDRGASQSATLLTFNTMEADDSGNIVLGGALWDSVYFDASTLVVSQSSLRDMYIAKYDTSGTLAWVTHTPASGDQEVEDIAIDSNGDILATGYFFGSPDFDPGAGDQTISSAGVSDIFFSKYDAAGNFQWVKPLSTPGGTNIEPESGNGIGVDALGNIYLTGIFFDTLDFDLGTGEAILSPFGGADMFVAKYDAAGEYQWAFRPDSAGLSTGSCLSVLPNGDLYVGGRFSSFSGMDLDPSPTASSKITSGSENAFVAAYNTNGEFVDARGFRGTGRGEMAQVVSTDKALWICGRFENNFLFDSQTGNFKLSRGSSDMFVGKLSPLAVSRDLPLDHQIELQAYATSNGIRVEVEQKTLTPLTVSLLNAVGQRMAQYQPMVGRSFAMTFHQPVTRGLYYIKVETVHGVATQKVLVRN